jgi:hypothetical protein
MKHSDLSLESFSYCSRAAHIRSRLPVGPCGSGSPKSHHCFSANLFRASAVLLMCSCAARSAEVDKKSKAYRAASEARLAALKEYTHGRYEESSKQLHKVISMSSPDPTAMPVKIQAQADLALIEEKHGDLVKARDNYRAAIASMRAGRLVSPSLNYVYGSYRQFLRDNKMTGKDEGNSQPEQRQEYIGTAWITEDGTIRMRLRMSMPGAVGQTSLTYAVDDPRYNEILAHVGPIRPGEVVSVRPFE